MTSRSGLVRHPVWRRRRPPYSDPQYEFHHRVFESHSPGLLQGGSRGFHTPRTLQGRRSTFRLCEAGEPNRDVGVPDLLLQLDGTGGSLERPGMRSVTCTSSSTSRGRRLWRLEPSRRTPGASWRARFRRRRRCLPRGLLLHARHGVAAPRLKRCAALRGDSGKFISWSEAARPLLWLKSASLRLLVQVSNARTQPLSSALSSPRAPQSHELESSRQRLPPRPPPSLGYAGRGSADTSHTRPLLELLWSAWLTRNRQRVRSRNHASEPSHPPD